MLSQSEEIIEEIKSYRGVVSSDIDEKAELSEARDDKYDNLALF